MSLFDRAPRLALANYGAQWERSTLPEFPGRLREILRHDHSTGSCRHCGAKTDRDEITGRLLQGCNAGHVCRSYNERCRGCNSAMHSNYRRPW